MSETELAVVIKDVSKVFSKNGENLRAVDKINITVKKGNLVTFLGPSGCGKTTTLRMVAGFELPTEGTIHINGQDLTNVPVNKRGIGFVFQNYALFPHMTIFNNVAYGLKAKKMPPDQIAKKVRDALDLVGLQTSANRFPNQLSGGEQQRVALARVIVMEPSLLLMDEPLSNLDAKLRIRMRTEIRKIQKKLGITCLYVTHDQSEALTVSDQIVVMSRGKVEQIGSPQEVYTRPLTEFVADFIGQANVIKVKCVEDKADTMVVALPNGPDIEIPKVMPEAPKKDKGTELSLVTRPENMRLAPYEKGALRGVIESSVFLGSVSEYEVELATGQIIKINIPFVKDEKFWHEGEEVSLVIDNVPALILNNQ